MAFREDVVEIGDLKEGMLLQGTVTREQFDWLAVAINAGTNIPSIATPNQLWCTSDSG